MPFACSVDWPPKLDQRPLSHATAPPTFAWAPGGLNWDLKREVAVAAAPLEGTGAPFDTKGSGSVFGGAAKADGASFGGLDADAAAVIIARARTLMANPDTSVEAYTAKHGIEAALNSVLNTIAKTTPAEPIGKIAEEMSRWAKSAPVVITPTLPSAATDEMEALRTTWLTLHGFEEGR